MPYTPVELSPAAKELGRLLYSNHCMTEELIDARKQLRRMTNSFQRIKQNTLSATIRGICDEHLGVERVEVET